MASEAGKGSQQRPKQVSNDEYAERWDAIFAREKDEAIEEVVEEAKENY